MNTLQRESLLFKFHCKILFGLFYIMSVTKINGIQHLISYSFNHCFGRSKLKDVGRKSRVKLNLIDTHSDATQVHQERSYHNIQILSEVYVFVLF